MAVEILQDNTIPNCNFSLDSFQQISLYLLQQLDRTDYTVSILLTDDNTISDLNTRYRKINKPTNVLSFPIHDDNDDILSQISIKELGDIVISMETAQREAHEYDVSFTDRMNWLLVHGLLHLLGYDHELSKEDEDRMFQKETELLKLITKFEGE